MSLHFKNTPIVTEARKLNSVISWCNQHGLEWRELAREVGLPVEHMHDSQCLPGNLLLGFAQKLTAEFGPHIGVDIGRRTFPIDISPALGNMLDRCDTFAEAVQVFITEMNTFSNNLVYWSEQLAGTWWLCYRSPIPSNTLGFMPMEWLRIMYLLNLCYPFLGCKWRPTAVKMMSSHPQWPTLPEELRHTTVKFSQPYGAIAIPLPDHCPPMMLVESQHDWLDTITRLVQTFSPEPWFSLGWFAQVLGVTPRTLQRHLAKRGTTFKALNETARKNKAIALLLGSEASITEIAWQVGYNDMSNFNRAFKKWTGETPSRFKLKLCGGR
ncbi:AraC family transcriptional regulator [Photobacterium rosenbergii]|uniref:AraC family transcriptional regulator n=1 Tax=Photobacterium rosenbergii TaxID=294936 RepID=A0ABU3ZHQ9_9GAMM|nr:AraC family transcriptional regulator [Photobacterium rosenbergii]MDV5169639.1 AraC family transcriptional regulator [Photobacterium rosenbergii]